MIYENLISQRYKLFDRFKSTGTRPVPNTGPDVASGPPRLRGTKGDHTLSAEPTNPLCHTFNQHRGSPGHGKDHNLTAEPTTQ